MSARDPDRKGMDTTGVVDYGADLENYSWTQTRGEVTCTINKDKLCKVCGRDPEKALKARDILVVMDLNTVKIGIKGCDKMFLEGSFPNRINTDDSTWTWDSETGVLELTLSKDMTVHDSEKPWWANFITTEPEIDVDLIEGSRYLDTSLLKKVKAEKQRKKEEEERKKREEAAQKEAEQAEKEMEE